MNNSKPAVRKAGRWLKYFAALVIFGLVALNIPADHFHEAGELREQLIETRSDKEQLMAVKAEAEQIGPERDRLSGEKARLEMLIPLKQELPFALVKFEEAVDRLPATVHKIRAGEQTRYQSFGKVKITLSLSAHSSKIESFLEQVSNLSYLIRIDSITWSGGSDNMDQVDLDLELFFIDPAELEPLLRWPEL